MKKKISLLLVLVMAVSVMVFMTGCGSSSSGGSSKSDDSWKYVKDKGTLVIGLDDTFAPMGFRDKNNKLVGFDIDLARAVGKELGVKVKFKPIDWDSKEAELKTKKIDCIWNGLSVTPGRLKSMTMSKHYLENRILIMSLNKKTNITDSTQLKDLKVGTQAGSSALEAIQKDKNYDKFKKNVKEYDDYDAALMDMKAGRIDVVVIDEVYAIYNNKNKTKLYESDYNFGADYYGIGFRKGDEALADKINDGIQKTIDDGQAKKISNKWFGKNLVKLGDNK